MKLRTLIATTAASLALLASTPALAEAHDDLEEELAQLPSGPEGPALWKVSDEDTTIYLFGTVHALDPSVVWYDAEIDAALSSADTIVTELRMDPDSEAAMQQLALENGVFTDGTTLRSLLDEEQTAAYEAGLASLGIPAPAFDRLEPWMAGLTLTMFPLLQQGYDLEAGVDKVILRKAGDATQDALETAEFQLGIFDSLPQDQQVEFLMAAVEGMGEVKDTLDAMVAEWVAGDADGLAAIMNEDLDDEAMAEALLYNRNANWAAWIDERLESTPGTVFIAVGAGHLAGERSVQDYLAERDIETTRVQ
ncbi:TraB/GumN family protein [uncultured Erythrobacter sp.]|uniref:TraB/GumN family protein n=1 Tax=uncultured Erythrobacter sp. TaxID=263913 RepID=UPI00261AA262|nr:TraB/GumN family protein [uncultured Erythrobacter sp.]